jgi:hypothetical protein
LRRENVRAEVQIVTFVVDQLERKHDFSRLSRSVFRCNEGGARNCFL